MLKDNEILQLRDVILNHRLQPLSFRILSDEEKKELLKKYNIHPLQLPKILESDVIARILNAKEGDIIEITRKSPTSGTSKYYRLVVKDILFESEFVKEENE